MVQYRIKSSKEVNNYLSILKEKSDGFDVLIVNEYEEYRKEVRDFLSRELFETCLRTGYLVKCDEIHSRLSA